MERAVTRGAQDHPGRQWGEFISKALDRWAYENGVTLDFSRPGKPTDNAFVGSFNGRLRDECLNTRWFLSLEDAELRSRLGGKTTTRAVRTSLGWMTPVEYAAAAAKIAAELTSKIHPRPG